MEDPVERASSDLVASDYAIALTGAGISTESGIPDFRGPQGVWTKDPDAERRAYLGYERFLADPEGWWKERLAKPVSLLGDLEKVKPNPGHDALAELERMGVLKCVITQNVDGLHKKAGSRHVLEYHGNAFALRCVGCNARFDREQFDLERLMEEEKLPPRCPDCAGMIKSDGVAFGEPIPQDVARRSLEEVMRCDFLMICGTSAVVYPFADLPRRARSRRVEKERQADSGLFVAETLPAATIVEINAEPTPLTHEGISDCLIQGNTGEVLPQLVSRVRQKIRERGLGDLGTSQGGLTTAT
jgi:NAD-dependent deacetylase